MRRAISWMSACALGAGALLAAAAVGQDPSPAAHQASAAPANLAGRWRLDVEKSEDARQKMREARERGGGREGGFGRGGGGFGGGRGGGGRGGFGGGMGGGRRPGGGAAGDMRETMRSLTEAPAGFVLTQSESEVVIVEDDGGPVHVLRPDGRKVKRALGDREVEMRTRWDGPRLVAETKPGGQATLTETYERSPDRRELWVTLRLEDRRLGEPVSVRRVYDAVASE